MRRNLSLRDRLLEHAGDENACWVGHWAPAENGYVRIWLKPSDRPAGMLGENDLIHRAAYRTFVGPIPPDHDLDHRCRNRACFNPRHLVPVLPVENNRRSNSPSAINATKVECKRGHPLIGDNVRLLREKNGSLGRACRECDRDRCRRYDDAHRAERAAAKRKRREASRPSAEYIRAVRRKASLVRWARHRASVG